LIRETLEQLCQERGPGKTFCPSDAARLLAGEGEDGVDWHSILPAVRRTALEMAQEGRMAVFRKGKPVDPQGVKGVIRLGLPPEGEV
jgi:hypothetical protein